VSPVSARVGHAPPPILSATFARAYGVTMRPYLCFVSGATGLVGLALTRSLATASVLVVGLVFFVAYGLGQALTDVTQLDTDAISSPYRPMVQGLIRPRDVLLVSLGGLGACALVLVAFNPAIALFAVLPIAGLATYTPMKRRFWAGPVWNAWIVAMLPFLGALTGGGSPRALLAEPAMRSAMATTFFAYLTFVLLGYLKDVEADRATGYVTLPVRFGRRWTVAASAACAAAALAISLPAWGGGAPVAGALFWSLGALLLVVAHAKAWRVTSDAAAHPAITLGLRGYVALHLGAAIMLRPSLLLLAVAMLAGFEVVLARRPSKEQV
jgi:geranylgeranylglycerol-phosphate geranylgeranyltransferase